MQTDIPRDEWTPGMLSAHADYMGACHDGDDERAHQAAQRYAELVRRELQRRADLAAQRDEFWTAVDTTFDELDEQADEPESHASSMVRWVAEARDWIADCEWSEADGDSRAFADSLTNGEVVAAITRHYDGGWPQFHRDAGRELAAQAAEESAPEQPQRLTYRERRMRKAERLRGWAEKREAKSAAEYDRADEMASAIPFGQPILVGHYSERSDRNYRDRIGRAMDRSCEHAAKAESMRSRADNIEAQAAHAIYSDDPDAVERLTEKIARLEAQREQMKQRNAAFRKEHRAELNVMTLYQRDRAMPHQGYELTNLSGNISRLRKRLANL